MSQTTQRQQESHIFEVCLDFVPLVKSIKGGKPESKGHSAKLSLKIVDSDEKRELFYLSGALQPLCKLLTDPKAAAQVCR